MNYKSLQSKIILIFSVPMLALIYFSYSFMTSKSKEYKMSKAYVLSAQATNLVTKLTHNIQLERGLSAGFLVSKNSSLKNKLIQQRNTTDLAYTKLIQFHMKKNKDKKHLNILMKKKTHSILNELIKEYKKIPRVRENILDATISLENELDYYTNLNIHLLNAIENFLDFLNSSSYIGDSFTQLQLLKENAGLQRAYIYNSILNNEYTDKAFLNVQNLQDKQNIFLNKFQISASEELHDIYNQNFSLTTHSNIQHIKSNFYAKKLKEEDARVWFSLSSIYIDQLQKTSDAIINQYINDYTQVQKNAKIALYITIAIWIFSIFAYFLLIYILRRLIRKEKELLNELRISSYTFDSYEAMVLTNTEGIILQVNPAFTKITKYEADEAIGKKTSILRSFKHSDLFYQKMWSTLLSDGKWSDEIYNKRKNGEIYLERLSITAIKDDDGVTTNYIAQFLDINDLKVAQKEAEHQANHDFLTGLLNRKALISRLQEEFVKAKRHNFVHAFLFIDLDDFKAVNDTYGHAIGDKVLVEVAQRIRTLLREEDIVSRMSGDEFGVILLNLNADRAKAAFEVKTKCHKIIQEISKEFNFNDYKVSIGSSIGIKIFPSNEISIQDIIIHSDTAMYQAKDSGKNTYVFFDKEIELRLKEISQLEEELQIAVQRDEFEFYLQPKVNVAKGTICGAEALVRWQHPQRGLLFPVDFLDIASNIALIPKITKLALKQACSFIQTNRALFEGSISINIKASELLEDDFEKETLATIRHYNISPSRIELEILEDDLIEDIELAIKRITSLKKVGLKLSIDDFGTGYSSITYLKRLPVDNLKLDKNFTQNLHEDSNKELIKMMINMAKTFNMRSVVEGVETLEQLEFIKSCGADTYQGYYFSKAVPQEEFIRLLNKT